MWASRSSGDSRLRSPTSLATAADLASWSADRAGLNHDWLQNRYLNGLDGLISRVDRGDGDSPRIAEFLSRELPQWVTRADSTRTLLDGFKGLSSPRRLIGSPPLARLDAASQEWLANIAEAHWQSSHPASRTLDAARDALARADGGYRAVAHLARPPFSAVALTSALASLRSFRESCDQLAQALSALPPPRLG